MRLRMSVTRSTANLALDTISALATSPLRGGIGIVRISGGRSEAILAALTGGRRFEPRRLTHVVLRDAAGVPLDDALVAWMPGPASYTGEDVAELQVHGGAVNLSRVLRAVIAAGARPAQPGEFTERAFLTGRLDLARAEAVLDVIEAPTESALDLAQSQLRGVLSSAIRALRERLLDVQAGLEVQIDFSDEDLGDALDVRHAAELLAIGKGLEGLAATWSAGRILRHGARVVLAGPPNSGKSSLFNALLRQDRAIVTPIAGTTRDFIEERADFRGIPVVLIDTAGLRTDAVDLVEAAGIARTRDLFAGADLVLWLDEPGAPADPDAALAPDRILRVRTKADLGPGDVSVVTGAGLETLKSQVRERLLPDPPGDPATPIVTNARHHAAVTAAAAATLAAAETAGAGLPPELIAVDVREAVHQLGLILGVTTTEDLLGRIFSRFCIGK